ncbi:MarR family winged helix-turn-helix transcriptional regulator [Pseudomonas sp. TE3610]
MKSGRASPWHAVDNQATYFVLVQALSEGRSLRRPLFSFGTFMNSSYLDTYLLVTQARNALERSINTHLARANLTATHFYLLDMVHTRKATSAVQCGRLLEMTTPSVKRALDVLERKGFITRTRSDVDRRTVLIALAPAGQAAHQAALDIMGAQPITPFAPIVQMFHNLQATAAP